MASVLFLAPADLGETVLATGALAHVLRDGDVLTVSADADAAPLFRAAPAVRIWLPPRAALSFSAFALLRGARYDTVLDARRAVAGRIAPASHRIRIGASPMLRHRVEDWTEAVGADRPLAPKLWLDEEARQAAAEIALDAAPLLVLAPGGIRAGKRWPRERFAAIARRLVDGQLAGARVAVIGAAARDAEITRAIVASLDADGISALDLGAAPDLLAAAALMERATLVIGNDNALTHIAAAAGAPTLTLFGITDERVRAPYGPRTRTLRGRPFEEVAALSELDAPAAMEDVSTDAVEAAALELLRAGGLR
jgi:ADP-heptose:LPS heptosyltransferase